LFLASEPFAGVARHIDAEPEDWGCSLPGGREHPFHGREPRARPIDAERWPLDACGSRRSRVPASLRLIDPKAKWTSVRPLHVATI
jgi:hypothetical protein